MQQVLKINKYEACDLLRAETEDLDETLNRFTKDGDNIDMILSNKIAMYNKMD